MNKDVLVRTARAMVAPGKGILAADESAGTIAKRFAAIGVDSTQATRRDYRQLLFRAEEAINRYISGVILFDETIRQTASDGTPLVKYIEAAGAIPGIKVDLGAKPLANFPGETITEGLDGLLERLNDYRRLGARFAKWRAVISVDSDRGIPTDFAIETNAQALARYAALCQNADLVPIVEPEVLMDGEHDLERCGEVTECVLKTVFMRLYEARIFLEGMLLKPNMVVAGKKYPKRASPEEVALSTVRALKNCVPAAIPGVAFLSGGQSDIEATANLDAINRLGGPWALTFSYGRALQTAALNTWSGMPSNVLDAQAAFTHRAHMNALAAQGQWTEMEERVAP
ncbi:MAG: class I fructose-bisphosphate aldolase [Methylocystis sp.]|uniref:class I fructose-bisphosphate aldolase n=1 Tax=Methylocystis sp. TaxID=1911079 RepID=UPI003DA6780E